MEMKENTNTVVPEEELTEEEVVTEEEMDEEEDYSSPEDYKLIIDMLKQMDEQYDTLKEYTHSHVRNEYALNPDILTNILGYTEEDIKEKMSLKDMVDFVKPYVDPIADINIIIQEIVKNSEKEENINTAEDGYRKMLLDIKEDSMTIYDMESKIKELRAQTSDILKEYFTYSSSNAVRQQNLENLATLKAQVEKEGDELAKKKALRKIEDMEAAYSLSFLFRRLDRYGKKEVKNIKDVFFDKVKGSYIIEKYKGKIESFGYKDRLYRYFFNIEENFLPEKYHVYNNLFLFIYMRLVAYSDANNRAEATFVRAITGSMANLIYHRFDEKENENEFLSIVEKLLDYFEEYHDYFEKYNVTQPNHPKRIEATKKREAERRELLITKMNQMGITGYPEDACADDLQNYMNEQIEKLVQEQRKYGDDTLVEENEDGSVSITPKMEAAETVEEEKK